MRCQSRSKASASSLVPRNCIEVTASSSDCTRESLSDCSASIRLRCESYSLSSST